MSFAQDAAGLLVWILVAVISFTCKGCEGNDDAKRLYDDLLASYNPLGRPVRMHNLTVEVTLGLKLTQLIDVNERDQVMTTNVWVQQEWNDYRLCWRPSDYGGVKVLYVPSELIWNPDLVLYNNADGVYQVTLMTKAKVHYDGRIVWEPPAIYKSSCDIQVKYFPFDVQMCEMKFGSWTYDRRQVNLKHKNFSGDYKEYAIDLSEFVISIEWDLMRVPGQRCCRCKCKQDDSSGSGCCPCCDEDLFVDIKYQLELRRRTLFYTVNFIIPCVSLSFLTVCTFYLPVVSGEKISLCISILVSLTVFFLLLSETIPPTSLVTPLIGKYLLFTLFMVTMSVCVTVYVLNVHYRSPRTHDMNPWLKRVFLEILPPLLIMRRPEFQKDQTSMSLAETSKRFSRLMSVDNDILIQQMRLQNSKPTSSDVQTAMEDVQYIAQHIQEEDEINSVREDWQYIAMVLDRLFLYFFSAACVIGTLGMMLSAPAIYDFSEPVTELLKKKTNT
ncbi:PREDICTED: acetylcholine receptor subunit alpha-like 1 [Priapulus caudatus]|uniref:Acetylcholine receptor subunit alpha-like 1 n=1 Tax=Priapulus caudatus TaxID=37621 RepID=A0ABM1DV38_PRICU|nr:PREDICTED: acetylcholine receptor subunit alpha-like 1 [Priapulus caudatus]